MSPIGNALELGQLSGVDPFNLEPGAIIGERYCVVGGVRHAEGSWSVLTTDLSRECGQAPHHRVLVQHVEMGRRSRSRLRRAITADSDVQPQVHVLVENADGIAMVLQEPLHQRLSATLREEDAAALVVRLAELLASLHAHHVAGVEFSRDTLVVGPQGVCLQGFTHLVDERPRVEDVAHLADFVGELLGDRAAPLVLPPPKDAAEFASRARALLGKRASAPQELLPSEAPFVGRVEQLQGLQAGFRDALIARPSVTVIQGARGVGKSRVLREFEGWVRSQTEATVITGEFVASPNRRDTGLSSALRELRVAVEALEPAAATAVRKRLNRTIGEPGVLARHAPELVDFVDAGEPTPVELGSEFLRYTETLAGLLLNVGAGSSPLVLLLENVEHADACSVAVLRQLVSATPGHHAQVILTVRGEAPATLSDAGATILELDPLSADAMQDMLDRGLPGGIDDVEALATELHAACSGYPLAAWATVHQWMGASALGRSPAGRWQYDPAKSEDTNVEALFSYRARALTVHERTLAMLAVVRDGIVDMAWLGAVSGLSDEEVREAVRGLLSKSIFARASGTDFRFWHDEVRRALVETANEAETKAAHGMVADWLTERPKSSEAQLAYHLQLAGRTSDELVHLHLRAAHELLVVYESVAAQWHLEHALAGELSDEERVGALAAGGDAALLSGELDAAADFYVGALDAAPLASEGVKAAANGVHALAGRAAAKQAIVVGCRALDRVGQPLRRTKVGRVRSILGGLIGLAAPRSRLHAGLRSDLCRIYTWLSTCLLVEDPLNNLVCLLRAYRLSKGVRSGPAALAVAFYGGVVRALMGHRKAAVALLDQAETLASDVGDHWTLGTVNHLRGQMLLLPSWEYSEGQEKLDVAVEHYRRTGDLSVATISMYTKVAYGLSREPVSKLLSWLDAGDSMAARHGNEAASLELRAVRLFIEVKARSSDISEEARELGARIDTCDASAVDRLVASMHLSAALLRAGDLAQAKRRAEAAMAIVAELPMMPEVAEEVFSIVAAALLAQPTRSKADLRLLRQVMRRLEKIGKRSPRLHAAWLLASARRARMLGDAIAGQSFYARLLQVAEAQHQPILKAEAHAELSAMLAGSDVLAASEHRREARAIEANLGYSVGRPLPENGGETQSDSDPASRLEQAPVAARVATSLSPVIRTVVEASGLATDGIPVRVDAEDGLMVDCSAAHLQSLVVNVLLAARDSLPDVTGLAIEARTELVGQSEASEVSGGSSGSFVVIRVRARGTGARATTLGGLSGCRQTVGRLGGFIAVESGDVSGVSLAAYVPRAPSVSSHEPVGRRSRGIAAVVHSDDRIRRTVVSALAQLGYECLDVSDATGISGLPPSTPVFGCARAMGSLAPDVGGKRFQIVAWGDPVGRPEVPTLRVPFEVGELDGLLSAE